MTFPADQKVVDTMLSIPISSDNAEWYDSFKANLMDDESRAMFKMPAQYMFKDIPKVGPVEDRVGWTLAHMDAHNIERALIGFVETVPEAMAAYRDHRDRFFFDLPVNPNEGMAAVRQIRRAAREFGLNAVSVFPAGLNPQLPINDKKMYPIYAACAEEGLPIFVNAGVCGPRMPSMCQKVELIEEVVWFFPELKFVMRHGAEPDEALAVKLMLKYPNLYYSTSAFAPKHYPKAIINFMNSRGADKIIYAGYFPMGLSLDRIFEELRDLPIKDEVWPKFLYENAMKLLGAAKP